MVKVLKKYGYNNMNSKQEKASWDDDERFELDNNEELKKAFVQMNDEQLKFHLLVGGLNKKYAETVINFRARKNI